MEQHQAVKPDGMTGKDILYTVTFLIFVTLMIPLKAIITNWLHEHLSNTQNIDQEINRIIYDFEKDTKNNEDRYIEITTQLK